MMGAFLVALALSVWKVYKFMPNKQLEDDDTTPESVEKLTFIMIDILQESSNALSHQELFIAMKSHSDFDSKHFWRFNENRLQQLLLKYYHQHNLTSIQEIHKKIKS